MRKRISAVIAMIMAVQLCAPAWAEAPEDIPLGTGEVVYTGEQGDEEQAAGEQQETGNPTVLAKMFEFPKMDEAQGVIGRDDPETQNIASGEKQMQIISCPELGFSTLCDLGLQYEYVQEDGLYIYAGADSGIPYVLIYKAEGTGFDPEVYFDQAMTPQMQSQYGADLIDAGQTQNYTAAGVEMKGRMYTYLLDNIPVVLFRLFDVRENGFVCYTIKYQEDNGGEALDVFLNALAYYQPDANYYSGGNPSPDPAPKSAGDKMAVSCQQMDFSFLTLPEYSWTWDEDAGVTVYTNTSGYIPYIMLYRDSEVLSDPAAFISEELTPEVRRIYGDDLVAVSQYEYYTIGGRDLPAVLYVYKVQGVAVCMLRAYDVRDDHTLILSAKYVQGEEEAALAALDLAASTYQPDMNYYAD